MKAVKIYTDLASTPRKWVAYELIIEIIPGHMNLGKKWVREKRKTKQGRWLAAGVWQSQAQTLSEAFAALEITGQSPARYGDADYGQPERDSHIGGIRALSRCYEMTESGYAVIGES
jgi:hypothetical protein